MKFNFIAVFIFITALFMFSDSTKDTTNKDSILYKTNPSFYFDKVIQNPEDYKNDTAYIVNLGMNIFNSKDSGNRQPLYKSLSRLYNYMSESDQDLARDMCIYLIDYEYRNFNDLSASEMIVLLSLLGNSTGGKFKVNVSETLKKFIQHPSIQNLSARHSINAIIYSFKKFYYDTDAIEYITKIYELSSKWSIQDQRKLKL